MKILLLGSTGQLGWELERSLGALGEVTALDFPAIDLADPHSIRGIVRGAQPQVIVNATAYTAVDKAESEADLARAVNATGPGILAEEARKSNAFLVHYSTDYVFDGTKGTPYVESDAPHPLNVYGQSKLAGEQAIQAVNGDYLILRSAWLYSLRGDNFVSKVLQWARKNETLSIVDDQVSNPTWARMLAKVTALTLARAKKKHLHWLAERKGIYHLAGGGYASRYEWAEKILEFDPHKSEQKVKELIAAATADFPTPAQRPLYSALDCDRFLSTFGLQLTDWKSGLQLALK